MHPMSELMCFKSESSELWLIKTLSIEKDNDQDSNPGYDFCFFWLDQPQCHATQGTILRETSGRET